MAAKQSKVIITCAVTGSIHTPSMSPHLPVTPEEIAAGAIGAAEAGAAIVHLHAREPADGRPREFVLARFSRSERKVKGDVQQSRQGGGIFIPMFADHADEFIHHGLLVGRQLYFAASFLKCRWHNNSSLERFY